MNVCHQVRGDRRGCVLSTCLAYGVAVGAVLCAWCAAVQTNGLDYHTFWQVVDCCQNPSTARTPLTVYGVQGQQHIGMAADRSLANPGLAIRQRQAAQANLRLYQGRIETTATPFFYVALSPLVSGDYERDFKVFVAMSLLAHVASIALLCRVLGYSPTLTAWCVGLLSLPFLPFRSNIGVLNVGSLQLLQLAGVLTLLSRQCPPWRYVAAGCLLGGSIAFKPTLGPVAVAVGVVLASESDWRLVTRFMMGCVGGAAAAWVAGCLFLWDWTCWQTWLEALKAMLASERPMNPWNCSIPMVIKSIVGIDCSGAVLVGLLGGLAAIAYRTRRTCSSETSAATGSAGRVVLAGALGAVVALVASPLTWAHYHVLAVPLLLWVGRRSLENEGDNRCPDWYRTLAVFAFLLLSVVAQSFGLGRQANELILANVALLLLLGLGCYDLATARGVLR